MTQSWQTIYKLLKHLIRGEGVLSGFDYCNSTWQMLSATGGGDKRDAFDFLPLPSLSGEINHFKLSHRRQLEISQTAVNAVEEEMEEKE